jgi:hypothetical protein
MHLLPSEQDRRGSFVQHLPIQGDGPALRSFFRRAACSATVVGYPFKQLRTPGVLSQDDMTPMQGCACGAGVSDHPEERRYH